MQMQFQAEAGNFFEIVIRKKQLVYLNEIDSNLTDWLNWLICQWVDFREEFLVYRKSVFGMKKESVNL